VQLDKLDPFDVPVGVLGLELQVECIGQAIVQNRDDFVRVRSERLTLLENR